MWFEERIKPMLAEKAEPFDDKQFIFEIKWDGTRCISFIDTERKKLRLQNRRLIDITYRYPEFEFFNSFAKSCIVDGEVVVLQDGKPSFRLLQQREHVESLSKIEILSKRMPATYIVFDLLWIDGRWMTEIPLIERKRILKENLLEEENLMLSEYIEEKGRSFFERAVGIGFEGIVGKRVDSPYLKGRRSDFWLKVKKRNTIDAVVLGLMRGEGSRQEYFGSFLLGLFDGKNFVYIGRVGTGFDSSFLDWFTRISKPFLTNKVPFKEEPSIKRGVYWLRPNFVAEVEFLEVSKDGKLRAPVFKRLRFDKRPEDCLLDQTRLNK